MRSDWPPVSDLVLKMMIVEIGAIYLKFIKAPVDG